MARFIAAPRSVIEGAVGDSVEWRRLGEKWLEATKGICPVSIRDDPAAAGGEHLRDTLELRVITGSDPRLMIGSKTKGEVLGYLVAGTDSHMVAPVNASVLHWSKGGVDYYSKGHEVRGIVANNFPLKAITALLGSG